MCGGGVCVGSSALSSGLTCDCAASVPLALPSYEDVLQELFANAFATASHPNLDVACVKRTCAAALVALDLCPAAHRVTTILGLVRQWHAGELSQRGMQTFKYLQVYFASLDTVQVCAWGAGVPTAHVGA